METTQNNPSKTLNIFLWAAQIILAAMFLMTGAMKLTSPIEQLSAMLPWTKDVPDGLVRFIGASELMGGIGLLLPSILRIKPILTPIASLGLALIILFATMLHISRGESPVIGIHIIIMAISIFIAWGRIKKEQIPSKNKID